MIIAQFVTDNGYILVERRARSWITAVDKAYTAVMKIVNCPIAYLVLYVKYEQEKKKSSRLYTKKRKK